MQYANIASLLSTVRIVPLCYVAVTLLGNNEAINKDTSISSSSSSSGSGGESGGSGLEFPFVLGLRNASAVVRDRYDDHRY